MRGPRAWPGSTVTLVVGLGLCLAVCFSLPGCGRSDVDRLLDFVPTLDPEYAHALVTLDGDAFAAHVEGVGHLAAARGMRRILQTTHIADFDRFVRARTLIDPLALVAARAMETTYGLPWYRTSLEERLSRDWRDRFEMSLARGEHANFDWSSVSPEEELAKHQARLARIRSEGLRIGPTSALSSIADAYRNLGRMEEHVDTVRLALRSSLATGELGYTTQLLGVLGHHFEQAAQVDSMRHYWDRSLEIALQCRFAAQAARIYSFYGAHYQDAGRLALAETLFRRAFEVCRELKGEFHELRFVTRAMNFYWQLGCWAAVERLYDRARLLLERWEDHSDREFRAYAIRCRNRVAAALMAQGRVEQARQIWCDVDRQAEGIVWDAAWLEFLPDRAAGLVRAQRYEEALPLLERSLDLARTYHRETLHCQLWVLLAEAKLGLGRRDEVEASLARFAELATASPEPLRNEWRHHDSVLLELRRGGDEAALSTSLVAAFTRLDTFVAELDGSPYGYLFIERHAHLRETVHELLEDDPRLAFDFEMAWRALPAQLGHSADLSWKRVLPAESVRAVDCIRAWTAARQPMSSARRVSDGLAAAGADLHVLYAIHRESVLRWTVSSEGIRRDRLAIERDDLAWRIDSLLPRLSEEDRHARDVDDLAVELAELAVILLPAELQEALRERQRGAPRDGWQGAMGSHPRVFFTPDWTLKKLPFEALNLAADGGYEPLLARADVAYLRFLRGTGPSQSTGPGVVAAQPRLSARLKRLRPELGALDAGRREVSAVARGFGPSQLLIGERATKADFMKAWDGAPFIYIAAHVVSNPDVPYVSFVPMAADGETGRLEDSFLDLSDVRSADLTGCRMVALSTCSSGACHVEGAQTGPSLGDAFLDAGSSTVVQTFWNVEDTAAGEIMVGFLEAQRVRGLDVVGALAQVRRERIEEGLHPAEWASHCVQVTQLSPIRLGSPARSRGKPGSGISIR